MNDGYLEQRNGRKLTVNWQAAVVLYAKKVAWYGFIAGIGLAAISSFYTHYPESGRDWMFTAVVIVSSGMIAAGIFGGVAIIIKDGQFPYEQPYERIKSMPMMAAPSSLKPRPLMRQVGSQIRYGKVKLEPERLLALAHAVLVSGETRISQRKLAEWNVVSTKESQDAQMLKADLEMLGYAVAAGNGQLQVTDALVNYLAGIFPALSPHPTGNNRVSNGVVDRRHH
jgi:hypothetical protein